MKKLVLLFGLLICNAMQAYFIKNNSRHEIYADFFYTTEDAPEPRLLTKDTEIPHAKELEQEEDDIYRHFYGKKEPDRMTKVIIKAQGQERAVINLNTYGDEQLTRNENPVIFTINPDFTITASEEGKRFNIPPAPPAPPLKLPTSTPTDKDNSSSANTELILLANQLTTLAAHIKRS